MLEVILLFLAAPEAPQPTSRQGARVTATIRILRESTQAERDWQSSKRKLERQMIDEQGRPLRLRLVEHE